MTRQNEWEWANGKSKKNNGDKIILRTKPDQISWRADVRADEGAKLV